VALDVTFEVIAQLVLEVLLDTSAPQQGPKAKSHRLQCAHVVLPAIRRG
jgi:hypothetical protein